MYTSNLFKSTATYTISTRLQSLYTWIYMCVICGKSVCMYAWVCVSFGWTIGAQQWAKQTHRTHKNKLIHLQLNGVLCLSIWPNRKKNQLGNDLKEVKALYWRLTIDDWRIHRTTFYNRIMWRFPSLFDNTHNISAISDPCKMVRNSGITTAATTTLNQLNPIYKFTYICCLPISR